MPEFMSLITDVADMLGPQWADESKGMGAMVMRHFWDIAKKIAAKISKNYVCLMSFTRRY